MPPQRPLPTWQQSSSSDLNHPKFPQSSIPHQNLYSSAPTLRTQAEGWLPPSSKHTPTRAALYPLGSCSKLLPCSPALLSVNTSYTNPVPGLSVSEGLRVYARDLHPFEHQRSPSHPTPVSLVQGDKQERKMKTLL